MKIKAGFIIDEETWNSFVIYARQHKTDASKLLRDFVKDTLQKAKREID